MEFFPFFQGLRDIHESPLKYHGSLTLKTCLVDNHFTVKIGYLGFERLTCGFVTSTITRGIGHEIFKPGAKNITNLEEIAAEQRQDLKSFGFIAQEVLDFGPGRSIWILILLYLNFSSLIFYYVLLA